LCVLRFTLNLSELWNSVCLIWSEDLSNAEKTGFSADDVTNIAGLPPDVVVPTSPNAVAYFLNQVTALYQFSSLFISLCSHNRYSFFTVNRSFNNISVN
jgi:hypothetical protein